MLCFQVYNVRSICVLFIQYSTIAIPLKKILLLVLSYYRNQ